MSDFKLSSDKVDKGKANYINAKNIPPFYLDMEISRTIERLEKTGKLRNMTMADLEEEILRDITKNGTVLEYNN
ncbi:MAG: hypothetical protein LBU51_02090 [Bacteroidales bacterium]|nr:hypothetical protein [Bacteroidales bacterium]